MQNSTLPAFISKLSRKALWILDIDSTLVLTHKRNEAILHRFAADFRDKYPLFCEKLAQTDCRAMEYGYGNALERAGVAAETEPCAQLAIYWRKRFFSGDFLHHDIVHGKAVEFVQTLQKKNLPYVYLTGRPHETMYEGTLKTLRSFGFLVTPDILFLKPKADDIDEVFKSKKVASLLMKFPEIVFFDNEPKVLNQIAQDHPGIPQIFMDTCHSPKVTAPAKALVVKDFDALIENLI